MAMDKTQEHKEDSDVAPIEQIEQTFREGETNKGLSENPQILYLENNFAAVDSNNQTGMSTKVQTFKCWRQKS